MSERFCGLASWLGLVEAVTRALCECLACAVTGATSATFNASAYSGTEYLLPYLT